jgi:hypothetical protein
LKRDLYKWGKEMHDKKSNWSWLDWYKFFHTCINFFSGELDFNLQFS